MDETSIEGMQNRDCYKELRQTKFAGSATQACAVSTMLEHHTGAWLNLPVPQSPLVPQSLQPLQYLQLPASVVRLGRVGGPFFLGIVRQ